MLEKHSGEIWNMSALSRADRCALTFVNALVSCWSLFLTTMPWPVAAAIFLLGTTSLAATLLIPFRYGRLGALKGFALGVMYLARLFANLDDGGYWPGPIIITLE